jgi:hypothetical protein
VNVFTRKGEKVILVFCSVCLYLCHYQDKTSQAKIRRVEPSQVKTRQDKTNVFRFDFAWKVELVVTSQDKTKDKDKNKVKTRQIPSYFTTKGTEEEGNF